MTWMLAANMGRSFSIISLIRRTPNLHLHLLLVLMLFILLLILLIMLLMLLLLLLLMLLILLLIGVWNFMWRALKAPWRGYPAETNTPGVRPAIATRDNSGLKQFNSARALSCVF